MEYSEVHVSQMDWYNIGNLTTVQAALTTDKSADTVHALTSTGIALLRVENGAVAHNFRFRGGTDGQTTVVNLYAMRGTRDHYTRIATLTLTTGTQTDGTYLFIDTIGVSNEKWVDDIVEVSDGANGIAQLSLNTHGHTRFLFIATTLNPAVLYIDTVRE